MAADQTRAEGMSEPTTESGRALLDIISVVAWFDDETDYPAAIRAIEDEASGRDGGPAQPAFVPTPCKPPTNHRYARIGVSDMLRCRLCGFERPG